MKRNFLLIFLSILFIGSMKAQNHYTPEGAVGSNAFAVWANVLIDGEVQTSTDIEVGMFYDDVCVKTQRIRSYFNGEIPGAVNLSFAADAGQTVTFKLYNHAVPEELLNCSFTTETPDNDTVIGSPAERINLGFAHTYEIAASATEGGTVTGAGTYDHGTSVTLTATPNEGYNFVNWTEDGTEVSTDAEYTFTVTGARTLVANFEEAPYGPAYPWTVNPSAYSGNGYIMALVQINGVTITDGTNWEVGAFNGDHCNGVGNIDNFSWVDTSDDPDTPYDYYLMMMLYGNGGEQLNFYLYDRTAGEVVEGVCDITVTYTNDCEFGDFWEPYILNFVTVQTYTKDIIGYGEGDGHYYLIASPIGQVDPNEVGGMFEYDHDLYYFDQNASDGLEWINFDGDDGNFNLEPGKGYLYASKQDVTLTFYGQAYNGEGEVTLAKHATNNPEGGFEGWNLVGNPFAQTAYIDRDFYVMRDDGAEIILSERDSIRAMEGIFVIAASDGETMEFSTTPIDKKGQIVLNVTNRGNLIDRAIVRFGGNMLPKVMLNPSNTKMYISKEDNDFAVVRSNKSGSLPVNFEPAEDGTYSLNGVVKNIKNVRYLHLIDNMTGEDIDLLRTPEYKFDAKKTDRADRFVLVFSTSNVFNTLSSNSGNKDDFSFFSNGNWIINNEGEAILQVVDVEGRILSSEEISGCVSKRIEAAPGIYMLRLINGKDNMKVQKIVVE